MNKRRGAVGAGLFAAALLLIGGRGVAQSSETPAVVYNDTGSQVAEVIAANQLIRAERYQDAKRQLTTYLGDHPADKDGQALLGVADAYLNDAADAVAAFDAAGAIPDVLKVVASKAYSDAAVDALKAKDNDRAIALSTKALALQENVNTLFIRGTAYADAQNYSAATADLEKAKALASAGHADDATLNAIDASLSTALIFGGRAERGLALARALKQRDPSNTRVDDALAGYYNQQALAAMRAGDKEGAVARLEAAAQDAPSRAVALYVQAANILAAGQSVDWVRVTAEAQKALAIDANDARANYVAGIATANAHSPAGAIVYLQKAKANAGSDADLLAQIVTALKALGVQ